MKILTVTIAIVLSYFVLLGAILFHQIKRESDHFTAEAKSRLIAIEEILDLNDILPSDLWHMLNIFKNEFIYHFKVMSSSGEVVLSSGFTHFNNNWIKKGSLLIKKRGYITYEVQYIIDNYSLLKFIIKKDYSYILGISIIFLMTIFLIMLENFLKRNRDQRLLDLFAVSSNYSDLKKIAKKERSIEKIGIRLINLLEEKEKTKKQIFSAKKTIEIASQVSHDIRSPLSAMNMIMGDLDILPETTRLILRSSMQRIQDIANNLSTKKKNQSSVGQNKLMVQLLSGCVEEIISEKRLHFRPLLNVTIERGLDQSYGVFAKINIVEFKRVLSNLINNAVEAFNDDKGVVTIHLKEQHNASADEIQIIVEDDGKGIPAHIMSKLGQRGASFGKENHESSGSGLGLHHAKKTVESWGGSFDIESIVNVGTKMILTLPQSRPPSWFVSGLEVNGETAVVILDDDQGIHQTWDQKLKKAGINEQKIFHLSSPDEFSKWAIEESSLFEQVLYLCDFELIGFDQTGLDLIEQFSLGQNAILVTSHYEEENIQKRCEKAGIKLIPKMIVAYVPLVLAVAVDSQDSIVPKNHKGIKSILLDDDILTRMVWQAKAKEKGIDLEIFEFSDDLFNKLEKIPNHSIFYIDSRLANDERGEDVAHTLFEMGHKNLYLATGYEPEVFENLNYLKGIIGKSPPW